MYNLKEKDMVHPKWSLSQLKGYMLLYEDTAVCLNTSKASHLSYTVPQNKAPDTHLSREMFNSKHYKNVAELGLCGEH